MMSVNRESRDGGKWPDSKYILKGGPTELADATMKEKEESCMSSRFLACTTGRMQLPFTAGVQNTLEHRWQPQGPWAEAAPPPRFIWPGTLFLPRGSAELSLNG